jgi:hypothetical protein
VDDERGGGLHRDGHAVADEEQNVLRFMLLRLGGWLTHSPVSNNGLAIVVPERGSVPFRLLNDFLTVCLGGDIYESQFLYMIPSTYVRLSVKLGSLLRPGRKDPRRRITTTFRDWAQIA